ncbi:MAG TPA: hypothetical protein VK928_11110 [Longimicrobiales bacterium]|nr:hypothetical protein [Longimicrobiales bacterium]
MAGDTKDADAAERNTRNEALQNEDDKLHDPDQRTPHRAVDRSTPARQDTPDVAKEDIANLENPPQTEGPRERNNDAV